MQYLKFILILMLGSTLLFSCSKTIEHLQADPNNPTTVPANLILGAVLTDLSGTQDFPAGPGLTQGAAAGTLGGCDSWDNVHRWNQYFCSNYSYYNVQTYSWTNGPFDAYEVMKNVEKMDSEAVSRGIAPVNAYEAIGRFVKCWYYYNMTSMFGDIPQVQALQGLGNFTPAYTPQKQVFQYILNTLDTANTEFASLIAAKDATISGSAQDIYFAGNLSAWQKVVNSFRLRVLIGLSLQASDPDLNVPAQFANIFNNPNTYPIFQSTGDDLQFVYQPTYDLYYFSPANYGSIAARYNMAQTYVQALTTTNDPRVFVTSEPAWRYVDTADGGTDTTGGYKPNDFRVFVGASTGEAIANMYSEAGEGLYSFINRKRYFTTYVGEPDVLVGYKEMCFNIAEAINRGWITGNAETWYMNGIEASMQFYGIDPTGTSFTADFQKPTQTTVGEYTSYTIPFVFNTWYSQAAIKYTPGAPGINQIILQKYIAMFNNSAWEAYFNWRRTGIPSFVGGTGVGNNGVVPLRWAYPVTEQSVNTANWQAALANQNFSTDDLNGKIWMLQ